MIVFKAPCPNFIHSIVLPNPKLGNSETRIRELDIKRTIDGTLYTYAKNTSNFRLVYQIEMTRQKSLELKAFISRYTGFTWEMINHKDVRYKVKFLSDFILQNFKRSWYKPDDPLGSQEAVTVDIELEARPL